MASMIFIFLREIFNRKRYELRKDIWANLMPTNLRVTTFREIGYAFDDFWHFLKLGNKTKHINQSSNEIILSNSRDKNTHHHTRNIIIIIRRRPRDYDRVSKCNRLRRTNATTWLNLRTFFFSLSQTWWWFVVDDLAFFFLCFASLFIHHTVRHLNVFLRLSLVSSSSFFPSVFIIIERFLFLSF